MSGLFTKWTRIDLPAMVEPDPEFCLFGVNEFRDMLRNGELTPDDGTGYWATDTEVSDKSCWSLRGRPREASFVVWYPK